MTKLTDTQLIVLSSAAKHDDGLATRPANLNAAAAMKVLSSLIGKGLMSEPQGRILERGKRILAFKRLRHDLQGRFQFLN
jgi:hypothetical protein